VTRLWSDSDFYWFLFKCIFCLCVVFLWSY